MTDGIIQKVSNQYIAEWIEWNPKDEKEERMKINVIETIKALQQDLIAEIKKASTEPSAYYDSVVYLDRLIGDNK